MVKLNNPDHWILLLFFFLSYFQVPCIFIKTAAPQILPRIIT